MTLLPDNDIKELNRFAEYLRLHREKEFEDLKLELDRERKTTQGLSSLVEAKQAQLVKMARVTGPKVAYEVQQYRDPTHNMISTYQVRMHPMAFGIFGGHFDEARTDAELRHFLAEQFAEGIRKEAFRAMEDAILRR